MTTYSHTITMDDGERIAMEAALESMIEICSKELEAGGKAPFIAQRQNCRAILDRLRRTEPVMTSRYIPPSK